MLMSVIFRISSVKSEVFDIWSQYCVVLAVMDQLNVGFAFVMVVALFSLSIDMNCGVSDVGVNELSY